MKSLLRKIYINRSLRVKFSLVFFCIAVLPFAAMVVLSISEANQTLTGQTFKQMQSVLELKKAQLDDYFTRLVADVDAMAKSEFMDSAMIEFHKAFQYDGGKVGGQNWSEANFDQGPWLQGEEKTIGLKDILLADQQGNILYAEDQSLVGINLNAPDMVGSSIAKAFAQGQKKTVFMDLAPFSKKRPEPAAFIATPIPNYAMKSIHGVLIAQLSWDRINKIAGERSGMGESGETLLVGPDKLMRSDSFLDPEHHSIQASFAKPQQGSVNSSMAADALDGQSGLRAAPSYHGEDVLSAFSPIQIHDTHWALLVEINKGEALAGVTRLAQVLGMTSVVGLVIIIIVALLFTRSMTSPLSRTVEMIQELESGRLQRRLHFQRQDEIGTLAIAMDSFADSLQTEVVANLQKFAEGNLDFNVTPRDEEDKVRGSLQKLQSDLNDIISQIQIAGEQIAQGSSQVSDASQSLSQGATEQAGGLEEISASLNQMAAQTTTNAENANQANLLATDAQNAAQKGSAQMKAMVTAMAEINDAGQNISKIIKTIDEIAFQTNLLALNAAVEAARAGQHGKGFAVVAEEVRNLAARSAKAAEETAILIKGSVEKTENGSQIANQTSNALQEIVGSITKVSDLVGEIAMASNEQAQGITQINQGVTQIDRVTQRNTANAEESAAAAEELFGQAEQMRSMLRRFTLSGTLTEESIGKGHACVLKRLPHELS